MSDGVIRAGEIYRKDELLKRAGLRQAGWRTARRQGLRVLEANGRCFVRGEDWLSYLESLFVMTESQRTELTGA